MNVYLPSEAIVRDRRRFLDWRFLSALAALLMVAFLVYAGFRNYAIRESEAAQKDALIVELSERADQISELERDIARLTKAARQDRREASRERAKLLRQQERMIRLLQRFGITPPTSEPQGLGSAAATPDTAAPRPAPAATTGPPSDPSPAPKPDPGPKPGPTPPQPPALPPAPVEPPAPLDWLPLPDLPLL